MFWTIFPQYDSTIYEKYPERNTGIDQILELSKFAINSKADDGVYWDSTSNSRILIKFDLQEISSSIVLGKIPKSTKYYLKLYTATSTDLPINYNIYAYPVAQSWENGNGNLNDLPEIKTGVSWKYRGIVPSTQWNSGSGIEMSWQSYRGGGSYYTSSLYACSQSFNYQSPDIRMDITKMVKGWLSSSISNNGLILKRSNLDESGSTIFGRVKYFSKDTHTIFLPRLEMLWNDTVLSGINNFQQVGEDYTIHVKNVKPAYNPNSRARIRIGSRDRYPVKTYSTSSNYRLNKRLPTSSYYSILDYATGDTIIPFDTIGTKISCDSEGNYFDLRMDCLFPERYYSGIIKVERNGGNTVDILDNYFIFKVTR